MHMGIKRYKDIFPIIIYAGNLILYAISTEDLTLRTISTVLVFISAVCMGINVWKLPSFKRKHCAVIELVFCIITFWASYYLPRFIGNILSSVCIISIVCIYVFIIAPKWLQRKIM